VIRDPWEEEIGGVGREELLVFSVQFSGGVRDEVASMNQIP
jgi:hypothetical protein